MTDARPLLKPREAAKLLAISLATLHAWRARGDGPPHVLVGARSVRYRPEDVAAWVEGRRVLVTPIHVGGVEQWVKKA